MSQLLDEALDRFKVAEDNQTHNAQAGSEDLNFIYTSMWSDQDKKARQTGGQARPCLEFNLLLKEIKKIGNESRLNKPNVKVSPEDDKADVKTSQMIGGLISQILKNSNFDTVNSSAFENALENGFGYYRVLTKFVNDESFDQDITIDYIENPFSVYLDPEAKEITKNDAEWGFITDDIPKKEFERQYPDATITSFQTATLGNAQQSWMTEDTVRVAEYYRLEKVKDTLIEGVNSEGETVIGLQSELDDVDSLVITRERPTHKRVWKWYLITGSDILDEKKIAGPDFPIIALLGRRKNIDNKEYLYSLIRFSKDANKMYNYWRSSEAERLAQSLKTPYIGAKGQFKSDKGWKNANNTPKQYLEYDPVPIGGQLAPPPQRQAAPDAPIGYISAAQSSKEDVKETLGFGVMTNNTTGANKSQITPNALSGIAMETLNAQAEMSTYDFIDNMNKAARQCFRVINNLIPKIYDTERVERIINEEMEEELVVFNGPNEDGELYDLTVGRYDVDIDVGADYATKRKETAASMMEFVERVPEAAAITADLIAKSQDWKDADKFADRFKKQIAQTNPTLLEDEDQDENTMAVMISQLQQQNQELTTQLDQALELIQTRQVDLQIAQGKEEGANQRELIKSQTTLEKQRMSDDADIKEETIRSQSDIIQTLIEQNEDLINRVSGLEIVIDRASQAPLDTGV